MSSITDLMDFINEDRGDSIFYFFAICMIAVVISAFYVSRRSLNNPENTYLRWFDEQGDEWIKNKKGKLVRKGSNIREDIQ